MATKETTHLYEGKTVIKKFVVILMKVRSKNNQEKGNWKVSKDEGNDKLQTEKAAVKSSQPSSGAVQLVLLVASIQGDDGRVSPGGAPHFFGVSCGSQRHHYSSGSQKGDSASGSNEEEAWNIEDVEQSPCPAPASFESGAFQGQSSWHSNEREASSGRSGRVYQIDVFLSFIVEDTGNTFAGHLCAALEVGGIRTFMDERLQKGDQIEDMLGYIVKSKIFVPIFSRRYAQLWWCQKEVAKAVETKRLILPVYFDVEPADVRNQRGQYEDAFQRHVNDKRLSEETVSEWRDALRRASDFLGYSLATETQGHEAELIEMIARRIFGVLRENDLDVGKYQFIGINNRIKELMELIDVEEENGARMVGIHGSGGIGKTTLAKAIFNKISPNFEFCSFISNIREVCAQRNGLISLQNQLIRQLSRSREPQILDPSAGCKRIKELMDGKVILLALDDEKQLDAFACRQEWLSPKSKIIVTSRYQQVLSKASVERQCVYPVKRLSETQSLELFCCHAFGKDEPTAKLKELSKGVVQTTNGIPLILEVFGSLFSGVHCAKGWRKLLRELQENQHKMIHERLRISYNGLEKKEQQIFLDIARLIYKIDKAAPFYTWDDGHLFPHLSIQTLQRRSLIKITSDGQFEMHDEIREMGRAIVERDDCLYPYRRSRLWNGDSMLEAGAASFSGRSRGIFQFDVFLSFRGRDTRKTFTGHLYAALTRRRIHTFIDYKCLKKGESIHKLLEYIDKSKIFVPIISEATLNHSGASWRSRRG
ncbi:disease resistance protein L6-like [Nymphaea colorata]|nr:disease resistance protein L6-like [Nymphaea colorata]